MPLKSGIRLGPYEIVAPLGAGGMGEVYRARDTRLERTVAIKILSPALTDSPDVKARFEREARSISQLNDPHICTLYDIGHQNGTTFLVMEYLEGQTLAERLQKGALPISDIVRIGVDIADALHRAHRAGIIHRDLKPGNIMLTKSGAKLLDFGLAKPVGAATGASTAPLLSAALTISSPSPQLSPLTTQGGIIGTIQYMSPEQIQGLEADARSDIFALGAVLYEMATGKRPFEGKSQIKVASAILEDEPPPITSLAGPASAPFEHLTSRMLAKDPDQRWQCAADVKSALALIAAPSTSVAAPLAARSPSWKQVAPWAIAAVLLFTALALLFLRPGAQHAQRVVAYLMAPGDVPFDTTGDRGAPPTISPDGKELVFGAGGKLWLRPLDQDSARELEGTDGATFPFWSPNSKSIGLFQAGKLRTMDLEGGGAVTICDAPNARGGSWTSAGFILFAPTISSPIMKVVATGGTPVPTTTLKTGVETTHRWPQALPDGKHFIYFATSHTSAGAGDETGMFGASVDGGQPVRLLHVPNAAVFASGNLLFLRGTTLMAQTFDTRHFQLEGEPRVVASNVAYDLGVWRGIFTVSENGVLVYSGGDPSAHQLQWFSSSGKPENGIPDSSHYLSTALSPNGTRIAETTDPQGDLWVGDLNGTGRIRLTSDRGSNPVWSPDGRQIAYAQVDSSGIGRIVVRSADGTGGGKLLAPEPAWQIPTAWSPDGKYILYNRGDPGTSHIWAVPLVSGGRPSPVIQTEGWDRGARFSPDGKWIVFTSRESGSDQIYITPFPGPGPKWQASTRGGGEPRWSPDGKWICFWNGAHNQLLKVSVSLNGSRPVFGAEDPFINGAVYEGLSSDADYSLGRDGRVLVNRVGEQSARLTVVTNWISAMKP